MRRTFLLILDSLGVGAMPDAQGDDVHAHTLDHLVRANGGLDVPHLKALGLGHVPGVSSVPQVELPRGSFGRLAESSPGKDTSTGHWEMMGCPLDRAFPVYPEGFPDEIVKPFLEQTGLEGILCNAPASGTEVIGRLGEEHLRSGRPIVYTSADSVFQVAAHEEHFGLERLYEVCRVAREILTPYGLGRVIARPFVGEPGAFERTYNRRDFSLLPPRDTSLDRLSAAEVPVIGVGKIEDIFAGQGVTQSIHTEGNDDGMERTIELAQTLDGGFVFVNLVDFDMLYGHRRDALGYAKALETFDVACARLEKELRSGDLVLLSADHGNDPTNTTDTDHTREYVPLLAFGPGVRAGQSIGTRSSFADVGATVEEAFGLDPKEGPGKSFFSEISA